jgi:DNA-binding NarL/FixJ family response regulator
MRRLCVPGLTSRQNQILVACALGYTADEMARGLQLSRPTIFRHIELLGSRIFASSDLNPNRNLLATWAFVQRDCCAAKAWRMAEQNELFPPPSAVRATNGARAHRAHALQSMAR